MGYRPGPVFHEVKSDEMAAFDGFWSLLDMWLACPDSLGFKRPQRETICVSRLLRLLLNCTTIYMANRCHLALTPRTA
jgi:hypothetical protein